MKYLKAKDPTTDCHDPKPSIQRSKVLRAGLKKGGRSISSMMEELDCEEWNVRQHIENLHKINGFGYRVTDYKFEIIEPDKK